MMIFAADTHRGCVREYNEDCYHADPEIGLWLVADGVGGHADGELASAITSAVTTSTFRRTRDLVEAIKAAHEAVLQAIEARNGTSNMGSTIVAIAFDDMDYRIAWVGDSRAYLWNGDLHLLTRDHSYVEALIDKGAITPEQALHHPKRNVITRCIGITAKDGLRVDTVTGTLAPGQRILLCSDGLNDELSQAQLAAVLGQPHAPDSQVAELLQAALDAGGRDNITVLIVEAKHDGAHSSADNRYPQSNRYPHSNSTGAGSSSTPSAGVDMTIVQTAPAVSARRSGLLAAHGWKIGLLSVVLALAIAAVALL